MLEPSQRQHRPLPVVHPGQTDTRHTCAQGRWDTQDLHPHVRWTPRTDTHGPGAEGRWTPVFDSQDRQTAVRDGCALTPSTGTQHPDTQDRWTPMALIFRIDRHPCLWYPGQIDTQDRWLHSAPQYPGQTHMSPSTQDRRTPCTLTPTDTGAGPARAGPWVSLGKRLALLPHLHATNLHKGGGTVPFLVSGHILDQESTPRGTTELPLRGWSWGMSPGGVQLPHSGPLVAAPAPPGTAGNGKRTGMEVMGWGKGDPPLNTPF